MRLLTAVFLTLLIAAPARSQDNRLTLAAGIGTQGPSLSVATQVSANWSLRLHGGYWTTVVPDPVSGGLGLRSTGDLSTGLIGLALERALTSHLNASIGLSTLISRGRLEVRAAGTSTIAGHELSADELGDVLFRMRYPERPSLHLGLTWQQPVVGPWGVALQAGWVHTGPPRFRGQADGRLAPTAAWEDGLNEAFEDLDAYPVISGAVTVDIARPRAR